MNELERIAGALERIAAVLEDCLSMAKASEAEESPVAELTVEANEYTLVVDGRGFRSLEGLKAFVDDQKITRALAAKTWHIAARNLPIEEMEGHVLGDVGRVITREEYEEQLARPRHNKEVDQWWISTDLLRRFMEIAHTAKLPNYVNQCHWLLVRWLKG